MGSCSSNDAQQNGGEGFNQGNNGGNQGSNPGGESHRPHSRQAGNMATRAGNMAPHPEQPQPNEAADNGANAENVPHGNLVSPQMGAMANPMQPPQAAAAPDAQAAPAPQGPANGQGRPWIDFDPRTGKPMLGAGQVGAHEASVPLNNAEENRKAFEAAAGSAMGGQFNDAIPQPNEQYMPPQAHMAHGAPLIIGAGVTVQEGHWEEFEAANNVMSLEEYQKSL